MNQKNISSQTRPLLTEILGVKEGLSAYAGERCPRQDNSGCLLPQGIIRMSPAAEGRNQVREG